METDLAKLLGGLGVGGGIAAIIFMAYQKLQQQYADLWKAQTDLWKSNADLLMSVVKDNTIAMTMNTAVGQANVKIVDALHRRLDREGESPSRRDPRDEPH